MPVVDVRNIPTVVEFASEHKVVEFTEEAVTAEVVVGPTVVEFSWGELVPGPGLRGGGVFEGTVHIDQDIPSLPNNSEPIDPGADYLMLYDASSNLHVKVLAQLGAGGIAEIPWATREETDAGVLTDKALNPDVGAYAYDRFRHPGQHSAGKGTETALLTPVSGVVTVDGERSNVFRLVLDSDVTFANPINPINGQTINIQLKQNVVGGHSITEFGSQWKFVNRINPVLSSAPNAIDVLSCQWNEIDGIMECSFLPNYGSGYTAPEPPTAADLVFTNVGGGNNIYRDRSGLNVNFRTIVGEGDIEVATVGDTIAVRYTTPLAVDYSNVPFLIAGDAGDYPNLPYARGIIAGNGIAIDTLTEGGFTISSDLVPVPLGGTTAQVLSKLSDDDYDIGWVNPPETGGGTASFPPGGTTGQALVKASNADNDVAWGTVSGGGGESLVQTSANPLFFKSQATDQALTANTTLTNATDLQVVLEGGKKYIIELHVRHAINATPDWKCDLNYTGTAAAFKASYHRWNTNGEVGASFRQDVALNTLMTWTVASSVEGVANFIITIETSTAGTFSFRFAQNTSDAVNPATLQRGSYIRAEQVWDGWGGAVSGAMVARAALQTFTTTAAAVSWDTEARDDENYYSNINPTRFTIPVSGWYTIVGTVTQSIDADDAQLLYWRKNGAAESNTQHKTRGGISTTITTYSQVVDTDYYTAGDYLELMVSNRTGNSTCYARATITRIGGATGPTGAKGDVGESSTARLYAQQTDLSITNNTNFQDTELLSSVLQPGIYAIEIVACTNCHATPDLKRRINFTGTATDVMMMFTTDGVASGSAYYTSFGAATDGVQSVTGQHITTLHGKFVVTSPGQVSWQIGQITASATPITFLKGSWMRITELTGVNRTIDTEIAADTPRGYWKLDETSGNFADSSGNGYTLTPTGTSPIDQYAFSAMNPDFPTRKSPVSTLGSATRYASAASLLGLTPPITTYTIEVWGAWTTAGVVCAIGANGETLAANFAMKLDINSNGTISNFFEYGSGSDGGTASSILGGVLDGKLHHLAITKDAATRTVAMYIDGRYVGGYVYAAGNEHTGGTSGVFSLFGSPGDSSSGVDGVYAGVAFYATALSEARVQAHAKALGLF